MNFYITHDLLKMQFGFFAFFASLFFESSLSSVYRCSVYKPYIKAFPAENEYGKKEVNMRYLGIIFPYCVHCARRWARGRWMSHTSTGGCTFTMYFWWRIGIDRTLSDRLTTHIGTKFCDYCGTHAIYRKLAFHHINCIRFAFEI